MTAKKVVRHSERESNDWGRKERKCFFTVLSIPLEHRADPWLATALYTRGLVSKPDIEKGYNGKNVPATIPPAECCER
jgi:hypothetical protein